MSVMLVHVLVVIFIATLIRSTFGFGEALVAVPLLALRLPVQVAAPLAVLVSITVASIVVVQDFRHIHVRSAGWLVVGTLGGIPLGLWLLTAVDAGIVKAILGLVIVSFALYSLRSREPREVHADGIPWVLGCGLVAGVLGGAYGMNGPPLVVYGSLRRWSAAHFRATLQAYFLPASILSMLGYWYAGLWRPEVTRYYLLALPATLVATLLGRVINRRLHGRSYLRYVYCGLLLIGIALVAQALWK